MDSIITQVNREDEQLNAFTSDKGMQMGGNGEMSAQSQLKFVF